MTTYLEIISYFVTNPHLVATRMMNKPLVKNHLETNMYLVSAHWKMNENLVCDYRNKYRLNEK